MSDIDRSMDKMLEPPPFRHPVKAWMLCLLMGMTALTLLQMMARHPSQSVQPVQTAGL